MSMEVDDLWGLKFWFCGSVRCGTEEIYELSHRRKNEFLEN